MSNLKEKWVTALRSGKYEQIKGTLHTDNGYCCLGVLCEISGAGEWVEKASYKDAYMFKANDGTQMLNVLPNSIAMLAGLSGSVESQVVSMNDKGDDFNAIADWIEENV